MNCIQCGTSNSDHNHFCEKCGVPLKFPDWNKPTPNPKKSLGIPMAPSQPEQEKGISAASEQQSRGSKFGAMAGLVVTIAFFLPSVRSCGTELSGYDIATNRNGMVEASGMYWAILLAGLFCVALYFLVRTNNSGGRIGAAIGRLVAISIGLYPILNIFANVKQKGGAMEILYGGWMIALGYGGLFLSVLLDFGSQSPKNKP